MVPVPEKMVRRGGPSRACPSCKASKVKCDLRTPTCGRCLARGLKCSVPKGKQPLQWVDETQNTKKNVQNGTLRRQRSSSKELPIIQSVYETTTELTTPENKSPANQSPTKQSPAQKPPPQRQDSQDSLLAVTRSPTSVQMQAETFFFRAFEATSLSMPAGAFGPYLKFLPKLLFESDDGSHLRLTVDAIASATLAQLPGHADLGNDVLIKYGKALEATSNAINDPKQMLRDETLTCIFLLSAFECYRPRAGGQLVSIHRRHLDGAGMLLQHRAAAGCATPLSRSMYPAFVQSYSIRRQHLPKSMLDSRIPDGDPLVDIGIAAWELPGLRADILSLRLSSESGASRVDEYKALVERAVQVDKSLHYWYHALPKEFKVQSSVRFPPQEKLDGTWAPQKVHFYRDVSSAYLMNLYRKYRAHVHEVLLECGRFLLAQGAITAEESEEQVSFSTAFICTLMDDLCATIPYLVENDSVPVGIGQFFLVSPLAEVIDMDGIPPAQSEWMENELRKIAFSEHPRHGPSVVMDARIAARMYRFRSAPAAANNKLLT